MKKAIGLTAILLTVMLLCTACSDEYEATGTITGVSCSESARTVSSSITLDNGVTYTDYHRYGCKIKEGTKVKITHDKGFQVNGLVVEGTKTN